MNGVAFSIKAPKECSKKFAAALRGNLLPKEMFLEYVFTLELTGSGPIPKNQI